MINKNDKCFIAAAVVMILSIVTSFGYINFRIRKDAQAKPKYVYLYDRQVGDCFDNALIIKVVQEEPNVKQFTLESVVDSDPFVYSAGPRSFDWVSLDTSHYCSSLPEAIRLKKIEARLKSLEAKVKP